MRLTDYLDKGASLGAEAPCLTTAGRTLTYFDVQRLSWRVARALDRAGIAPGDKVAILSANDPVAFGCVFGISRAGAVWCPVNPRNEAAENRDLLDFFDCKCLIATVAGDGVALAVAALAPFAAVIAVAALLALAGDAEFLGSCNPCRCRKPGTRACMRSWPRRRVATRNPSFHW